MTGPAYPVLFEQVIDEFNWWNFEYVEYVANAAGVSDTTLHNWYHGHVANL